MNFCTYIIHLLWSVIFTYCRFITTLMLHARTSMHSFLTEYRNVTIIILDTPYVFASLDEWSTLRGVDAPLWEEWIIIFWLLKLRIPVFFRIQWFSKWHQISKELFNTISYWIFFLNLWGFFFKMTGMQCLEWIGWSQKYTVMWYDCFKVKKKFHSWIWLQTYLVVYINFFVPSILC